MNNINIKLKKSSICNLGLFELILFSLPFDNLKIAPTEGWATITPIIALIYVILNINKLPKCIKDNQLMTFFIALLISVQLFIALIYNIKPIYFFRTFVTLVLGIAIYISFQIRYIYFHADIDKDINTLVNAYIFAYMLSVSAFYLSKRIDFIRVLSTIAVKRPMYRLSFSFTEPSFISVHLIGVLMLVSCLTRNQRVRKKLFMVVFIYLFTAILNNASIRLIIDFIVYFILLILYQIRRTYNYKKITPILIIIILISYILKDYLIYNPRFMNLVNNGIGADGSGSTRLFHSKTVFIGLLKEPVKSIFGYGMGNLKYIYSIGFPYTIRNYTNNYTLEIYNMINSKSIVSIYNLPLKICGELGFLTLFMSLFYIFRNALKNKLNFLVMVMVFWIFIQFDSYAHYSFWLLLFLSKYNTKFNGYNFFDINFKDIK